jgi:Transcriptional antiterminator
MVTTLLERRLFTILEMLANNKGIVLEELSEELDVSTRSIRTYLKQLKEEVPSNVVEIVKDNNSKYKLNIKDEKGFREILDLNRRKKQEFSQLNDPKERIEYLINRLVELNEAVTIDELAEEINVGRTTLVNDLKKVDKELKKYGLVLKGKTNLGIKIEGDELNLRLIILEHICKSYNDAIILIENNNIFESKEKVVKLRNEIKANLKMNKFSFTEALIDNLIRYITVMLLRLKKNNTINLIQDQYKIIRESKEYSIGKIIKNIIEKFQSIEIEDLETTFIVMPLLARNAPLYHETLRSLIIEENITDLRKEIFNKVFEFTGLRLEEDEKLIKGLDYHLHYALKRLVLNINYKNPMIKEIKEKCKLPYEVAKIAAGVIEEKYKVKVGEDEIGYLALHFSTYVERANEKMMKIGKAAVICSTGFGTAQLLIIKLRKILGDIIFKSFSDGDFSSEIAKEYDIIFTTVDLNIDTDTPMIKITSIFDDNQLKGEIERQIILNKSNNIEISSEKYILNRILDKSLVFYLKGNSLMENIECMLDNLIKKNIVSNDFKNRVIKREKKAGTAFGGYIALPHAVDEKVNQVIVSYGILDNVIMSDGKEVGLIILMAIPSENKNSQEMIVKTYEEIISLSNNKKIVQNLIKTKSYEEFEKVLRRR